MNIGDLFKKGYSIDVLDSVVADELLAEVRAQTYVVSQDYRDPELTAPMIADWDANTDREVIQVSNAPLTLQKLWRKFGESAHTLWFQQYFGQFSQGSVLINKYRDSDAMGWHYDVPDATVLQVLIYLGDSDYTEDDGGTLQIGKCRVNEVGLPERDSIIPVENVLPNHGKVVTILNTNPTLLHRVLPLKKPKSRYTLVCRYGYLENTFTLKKWRVMKGLE